MCNLSTVYQATILFRANGGTAKTNFTGGHRNKWRRAARYRGNSGDRWGDQSDEKGEHDRPFFPS